jgi:hypothetical protein
VLPQPLHQLPSNEYWNHDSSGCAVEFKANVAITSDEDALGVDTNAGSPGASAYSNQRTLR